MKRILLVVLVATALAIPVFAQEVPQGGGVCCKAPGGETTHYPMLGVCPAGTVKVSLAECGIAEPTPVPTVAPEPTPWTPKPVEAPSLLMRILTLVAQWFGKALGIPAGVMSMAIVLTGFLTSWLPRLKGRAAFTCTVAIALLGTVAAIATDNVIVGQEYVELVLGIIGLVLAPFGYNLTFGKAKDKARG